jgi:membrane protein YqaA with SNARE-associated domain
MQNRLSLVSLALGSIVLWIVGLVCENALPGKIPSHPTDAQLLTWVQSNTNDILVGSWLFMCGCILFVAFAVALRYRLPEGPLATSLFTALVMGAVFGILTQGDFAAAINKDSVSAATAGAFHHLGDYGFAGVELSLVLAFAATALLAFKAAMFPRWWGAVCGLFAVLAVIGPIGWLAVIFGLPIWTIVTPLVVGRSARRAATTPATAAA